MAAPVNRTQCLCLHCQRVMPSNMVRRRDNRYCEQCYVETFEPDEDIGGEKGEIDNEAAWDERIARITARLRQEKTSGNRGGGQAGGPSPIGVREYCLRRVSGKMVIASVG